MRGGLPRSRPAITGSACATTLQDNAYRWRSYGILPTASATFVHTGLKSSVSADP